MGCRVRVLPTGLRWSTRTVPHYGRDSPRLVQHRISISGVQRAAIVLDRGHDPACTDAEGSVQAVCS